MPDARFHTDISQILADTIARKSAGRPVTPGTIREAMTDIASLIEPPEFLTDASLNPDGSVTIKMKVTPYT